MRTHRRLFSLLFPLSCQLPYHGICDITDTLTAVCGLFFRAQSTSARGRLAQEPARGQRLCWKRPRLRAGGFGAPQKQRSAAERHVGHTLSRVASHRAASRPGRTAFARRQCPSMCIIHIRQCPLPKPVRRQQGAGARRGARGPQGGGSSGGVIKCNIIQYIIICNITLYYTVVHYICAAAGGRLVCEAHLHLEFGATGAKGGMEERNRNLHARKAGMEVRNRYELLGAQPCAHTRSITHQPAYLSVQPPTLPPSRYLALYLSRSLALQLALSVARLTALHLPGVTAA